MDAPGNGHSNAPGIPVTGAHMGAPGSGYSDAPAIPVISARVDARAAAAAPGKLDAAIFRTQAKAALIALGWKPAIATAAVAAAAAGLGPGATIEQWIREALRRCPRPVA